MTEPLSQIELISAIGNHLDKHGYKELVPRQFEAVISAANTIMEAMREPHHMALNTATTRNTGIFNKMQCDNCGKIAQPNDGFKWKTTCGCHDMAAIVAMADDAFTEYEKFVGSVIVDPRILTHSRMIHERHELAKRIILIASAT